MLHPQQYATQPGYPHAQMHPNHSQHQQYLQHQHAAAAQQHSQNQAHHDQYRRQEQHIAGAESILYEKLGLGAVNVDIMRHAAESVGLDARDPGQMSPQDRVSWT